MHGEVNISRPMRGSEPGPLCRLISISLPRDGSSKRRRGRDPSSRSSACFRVGLAQWCVSMVKEWAAARCDGGNAK
jgi:hypothetical protein